ncbi:MAG: hypothetical protein HQL31_04465, partial [Planctomycetes bacterium]|nr:hypothetical protein [Planctomycetota bacterium]
MEEARKEKEGGGCLFYGCLSLVAMIVIALALAYFSLVRPMMELAEDFVSDKAQALPSVTLSQGELTELRGRMKSFEDGTARGTAVAPLVLSLRDINGLIQSEPG